jgi:hypothetical protein
VFIRAANTWNLKVLNGNVSGGWCSALWLWHWRNKDKGGRAW